MSAPLWAINPGAMESQEMVFDGSSAEEIRAESTAKLGQVNNAKSQDATSDPDLGNFHASPLGLNDSPVDHTFDLFSPYYNSLGSSDSSTPSGQGQDSLSPIDYQTLTSATNQGVTGTQNGSGKSFMLSINEAGFPAANQEVNGAQNRFATLFTPSTTQPTPFTNNQSDFPAAIQAANKSRNGIETSSMSSTIQPTPFTNNQSSFPAAIQGANGSQDGVETSFMLSTTQGFMSSTTQPTPPTNQLGFPAAIQGTNGSQNGVETRYMPSTTHLTPFTNQSGFPVATQEANISQNRFRTLFTPSTAYSAPFANQPGFPVAIQEANRSQNGSGTNRLPSSSQGPPSPSSSGGGLGSNGSIPPPERDQTSALSLDDQRRKMLQSDPQRYSQRYWCPDSLCRHAKNRPQCWKFFFLTKKDRDEHFYSHAFNCWTPTFTDEYDACLAAHDYSLGVPLRRDFQRGDPSVFRYIDSLNREIERCSACQQFEASAEYASGTPTPQSCAGHAHLSFHNWIIHELDEQCGTQFAANGIRYEARRCVKLPGA
ncbi:hypothetical protein EG328_009317 [Venturia inaequalis]|uniref:Uncharacterized protein n=1 Tax=Venturia inaequalis TaxID=5025 RepID=A0A8H3YXR6_VENIN|nr:hypothetical protein EG328_009317 [Venturia inaequalis]KAE9975788.1 hypothetical protein EG327_008336 [Venturia inaequalis]